MKLYLNSDPKKLKEENIITNETYTDILTGNTIKLKHSIFFCWFCINKIW
jgi:hypothetical protein